MKLSKVLNLREAIVRAAASLEDEIAAAVPELFDAWKPDSVYATDTRLQYDGVLYKVLQPHTSQANWLPPDTPSLYAVVLIPDPSAIPEWVQPGSTNPYMKGDKVTHNGKTWESAIDNNVWEPGVYGWTEI